jgi:AraC-like DNA-binding protein
MKFDFDTRPSDSPLVESIWRTETLSEGASFISNAVSHWEMVITKQMGKLTLSIRGPETKASPAPIPDGHVEYLGIVFKHGVFMPHLPKQELVDDALHLPETSRNSFRLQSGSWQFPTFENADTFVSWWLREGLLVQDQVVEDVLRGQTQELSLRSIQRRFLYVTGLTYKTIQQIERAGQAFQLLQSGVPIPETAYQAGYFDQSHLTNSLRRLYGQTPAQLLQSDKSA